MEPAGLTRAPQPGPSQSWARGWLCPGNLMAVPPGPPRPGGASCGQVSGPRHTGGGTDFGTGLSSRRLPAGTTCSIWPRLTRGRGRSSQGRCAQGCVGRTTVTPVSRAAHQALQGEASSCSTQPKRTSPRAPCTSTHPQDPRLRTGPLGEGQGLRLNDLPLVSPSACASGPGGCGAGPRARATCLPSCLLVSSCRREQPHTWLTPLAGLRVPQQPGWPGGRGAGGAGRAGGRMGIAAAPGKRACVS